MSNVIFFLRLRVGRKVRSVTLLGIFTVAFIRYSVRLKLNLLGRTIILVLSSPRTRKKQLNSRDANNVIIQTFLFERIISQKV
jgi:hypothetical protein